VKSCSCFGVRLRVQSLRPILKKGLERMRDEYGLESVFDEQTGVLTVKFDRLLLAHENSKNKLISDLIGRMSDHPDIKSVNIEPRI